MAKQKLEIPGKGRLQYLVYVGLSIFVMGFVLVLYSSGGLFFQSYFGRINPLIVFLLIVILGFILFSFLLSEGSFEIYKKENLKGLVVSSGLAGLFGVIIILVDLKIVFPVDMNVPFPESILFYPAIAFLVEIIFHVFRFYAFTLRGFSFQGNKERGYDLLCHCLVVRVYLSGVSNGLIEPIFFMGHCICRNTCVFI